MRTIKIFLSFIILAVTFQLNAQDVLSFLNETELSKSQLELSADYSKEKINTATYYKLNLDKLESNILEFQYGNKIFSFIGEKQNATSPEQYYWIGNDQENMANINLFILDGKCMGYLNYDNRTYDIQDLGENMIILFETPNLEINEDDYIEVPESETKGNTPNRSMAGDGECKVRVLIAYTNQVNLPGRDFYSSSVARMNDLNVQFNNSGISHDAELVRVVHLNYNEPTTISNPNCQDLQCETLYDLLDNTALDNLRNLYDADIVMVVVTHEGGIAFVNAPNSYWSLGNIGWNSFSSASSKTFAHELGHIYGCIHNTEEEGFVNDAHGYNAEIAAGQGWRTILSYPSGCDCDRVNHFSNPNINYLGHPTGGNPNWHNCAGEINDSASQVADFETSDDAKILTADNLNNTDDFAYAYGHQTLATSGNYTVGNGAIAEFKATNHVSLHNGFTVSNGGDLKVFLGSCGNNIPGIMDDASENRAVTMADPVLEAEIGLSIRPNPMQSEAVIEFYNPKEQNLSLVINSVEGKQIKKIIDNKVIDEGFHSFSLTNDIDLKGIYICTLAISEKILQSKFIVLK